MKDSYKVSSGANMAPQDIISQVLGDWGPWQFRSVMIIFLCKIPAAWFMAVLIFTGPEPQLGEYVCQSPSFPRMEDASNVVQLAHPIPINEGVEYTQRWCGLYPNITAGQGLNETSLLVLSGDDSMANYTDTVDCDRFGKRHEDVRSIITDFDLVCSRAILVAVTQTFHLIGVLVGGVIATLMLNRSV